MAQGVSPYAGFWRRAAALLIDLAIGAPVYVVLREAVVQPWADSVYLALLCVAYCAFLASAKQATPGMRVMKVYAVSDTGARLSEGRALVWCVASIGALAIVFTPVFLLQKDVDVLAVNDTLMQGKAQGKSPDSIVADVEALTGMPYAEYYGKLYRAFLITVGLAMLWAGTVVAGKQKAGVHNWLVGVRFLEGRR